MEDSSSTKIIDTSEVAQILDCYLLVEDYDEKPYLIQDGVRIIL